MIGEYFNWCQIWCTQMIYESCNISIPICIYTKSVSILENRIDFLIRYILRTNNVELIKYFYYELCKLTLASKSNRYESSLVSASESDMISPTYSQINVPFGMFCIERIPQPIPYTRNACNRTVIPCCSTRLWQVLTLHLED